MRIRSEINSKVPNTRFSCLPVFLLFAFLVFIDTASAQRPEANDSEKRGTVERLISEADVLRDKGTKVSREASLEKYTQALEIVRFLGSGKEEAALLNRIGRLRRDLGDTSKALESLKGALEVARAVGDRGSEAEALHTMGLVYADQGEDNKAIEFYERALPIRREVGDRIGEARTLNNIGAVHDSREEDEKALEFFTRALDVYVKAGEKDLEASTLNNMGGVYSRMGEGQRALQTHSNALAALDGRRNPEEETRTLNRIATIHFELGDKAKALAFFTRERGVYKEIGDRGQEADALENIALVNIRFDEPKKAVALYLEALDLRRTTGDKVAEAATLRKLGTLREQLFEWHEAIDAYRMLLTLYREQGVSQGEAFALNNLGRAYNNLPDIQKALEQFTLALKVSKEIGDRQGEATGLTNVGFAYGNLGELEKELECYNLALPLMRELGNKRGEAVLLANIGGALSLMGEVKTALDSYNRALELNVEIRNQSGEASTLLAIGNIFDDLGESKKALDFLNRSLAISRGLGDAYQEMSTLLSLGSIHAESGDREKSLAALEQAESIVKRSEDSGSERLVLNVIGLTRSNLGDHAEALAAFEKALEMFRTVGDKGGEATVLRNMGAVHNKLGRHRKAVDLLHSALPLLQEKEARRYETETLSLLMESWKSLGNPRLAIFYGKQSVNLYQELRSSINELDRETRKAFARNSAATYRGLVDILAGERRFAEALQVLDMLKEEEYSDYLRRDPESMKRLNAKVALTAGEAKGRERYLRLTGTMRNTGTHFSELSQLRDRQGGEFVQQAGYEAAEREFERAKSQLNVFLTQELTDRFPADSAIGKRVIDYDRELQSRISKWGAGTVTIHTVVAEDRYRVILTTADSQTSESFPVKAKDLDEKVLRFRDALQDPLKDPRPLGRELYDLLVKPIEGDLVKAKAKTLVWSLDGLLRYLPLAALSPDGESYLAERYGNVIVSSSMKQESLLGRSIPSDKWKVFGGGVSEQSTVSDPVFTNQINFAGLAAVENELADIVREGDDDAGILAGSRRINSKFNLTSLQEALAETGDRRSLHDIVHLATHFKLGPDNSRSFLLLGENRTLTLAEVGRNGRLDFRNIEMVVLSACETASGLSTGMGTGAEVDSLATFIELRGARSVMASLWPVADESTSLLMKEFYRVKAANPTMTKAEALQKAQLAMISGGLKSTGKGQGCRSDDIDLTGTGPKRFACNSDAPYSHPYFWSPFVLIGNWR